MTAPAPPPVAPVRAAVEEAERDLDRMPFFIRPITRGKFKNRTGLSYDGWRDRLAAIGANDTPASVRARWPEVDDALGRLGADFRGAPERARKGMGDDPVRLRGVEEKAKQRAAAVEALRAWLQR